MSVFEEKLRDIHFDLARSQSHAHALDMWAETIAQESLAAHVHSIITQAEADIRGLRINYRQHLERTRNA